MKTLILFLSLLLTEHSIVIAKTVRLPAYTDYAPMIIWYTQLEGLDSKVVDVDTLKIGDKCPECKGTGTWVSGDGIEKKPCPHCLRDGIVNEGDPILTGEYKTESLPNDWDDKIPPLDQVPPIPPENVPSEIELDQVWSFTYKGDTYYYDSTNDQFTNTRGSIYKVNIPYNEWVKEGSINICTYNSRGVEISCDNCKLRRIPSPLGINTHVQPPQQTSDYATPPEVISRILPTLRIKKDDVFLDIGSGDGRVANQVALEYGCKAIGIEIDPERIAIAQENAKNLGVSHLVTYIQGDFYTLQWPEADVGYVYLYEEDLQAIRDKLLKLNRFASYSHKVPRVQMYSYNNGEYFVWKALPKRSTSAVGVWYGRKYYTWNNLPSNGRCNCGMCQWIKNQLRLQEQRG